MTLSNVGDGGLSPIAVEAPNKEVRPCECEELKQESGDSDPRSAAAAPFAADPHVVIKDVDEPRDEHEGLLGIPSPKGYSTGQNRQGCKRVVVNHV